MNSTYLVKEGNKPELVFRVTLSPDGKTYMKEYAFVFPKYRTADVSRYDPVALAEVQAMAKTGDLGHCEFIFENE
ncbi:hypothetical protein [uncultured Methanomethylovorans sp.]|uniref:hypothetical protein n=1 Tax=uncultured Methanomethylovorans sp. TaxID=183759 RepID=UPI002AA5F7E6|nr:hypothetical protein [uncultured Methanomethylovorans sp.]